MPRPSRAGTSFSHLVCSLDDIYLCPQTLISVCGRISGHRLLFPEEQGFWPQFFKIPARPSLFQFVAAYLGNRAASIPVAIPDHPALYSFCFYSPTLFHVISRAQALIFGPLTLRPGICASKPLKGLYGPENGPGDPGFALNRP